MSTPHENVAYYVPIGNLPFQYLADPIDRPAAKELYSVLMPEHPMTVDNALSVLHTPPPPMSMWNYIRVDRKCYKMSDSERAVIREQAKKLRGFQTEIANWGKAAAPVPEEAPQAIAPTPVPEEASQAIAPTPVPEEAPQAPPHPYALLLIPVFHINPPTATEASAPPGLKRKAGRPSKAEQKAWDARVAYHRANTRRWLAGLQTLNQKWTDSCEAHRRLLQQKP